MHERSINFQQDMDRIRATYDAVATRYADMMVNELDERPIAGSLTRSLFPSYPLSAQRSWTHFPMCRLCSGEAVRSPGTSLSFS